MDEAVRRAIGQRLRESRKSIRQTQEQVGRALGVERQTVSSWETGRTLPQANEWYELGLMYGASLDYLVYGIRTMPVSEYAMAGRLQRRQAERPSAEAFGKPERLGTS